jgi:hypothetical protein
MRRRTPEQIAILIAALLKRSKGNRMRLNRKSIRTIANSVVGRSTAWYAQIGEELAEFGISMFEISDTHFGFIHTAKSESWTQMGVVLISADLENPDFEKLRDEVCIDPDPEDE